MIVRDCTADLLPCAHRSAARATASAPTHAQPELVLHSREQASVVQALTHAAIGEVVAIDAI